MKLSLLIATAVLFAGYASYASNLLFDPGFESGSFLPNNSGLGGWSQGASAVISQDYAHGGSWSLKLAYDGSTFVIPALQFAPVSPQASYTVSGWGFTPSPSTFTGIGAGYLMVVFFDANFGQIQTQNTYDPMGIINGSTSARTWTFLSGSVTAPPSAAYLEVLPELFSGSAGNAVYFDDISVTPVPEPAELVLFLGLGFGLRLLKFTARP